MITLYARKEPTIDEVTLKYWPDTDKKDTVLYEDEECTKVKAIFTWEKAFPRTKKQVILNCYTYSIVWVD